MLKSVNSYDVFDTIIARNVKEPRDIFDIIEINFPYKNFKALRIAAEKTNGLTFETIYKEFYKLTNDNISVINSLKQFEINTEIANSFLIAQNYEKINDGDILVSDMYFSSEQIAFILKQLGFSKNVTIYSSSIGISKYSGKMYEYLLSKYTIKSHTGDNEHSDIIMAKKYNIKAILTTAHKFTRAEQYFLDKGCAKFCFFLRKYRLLNPYIENSKESNLYNDQIGFNIPLLILISLHLNELLIAEKRTTVLFYTRDSCLIQPIFELISKFNAITFHSSRIINKKENKEYDEYIKNTYDDDTCIFFDGHGSFNTGRPKYRKVLGFLPRVHIFSFCKIHGKDDRFDKLTYNVMGDDTFEKFNIDIIGTLLDYKNSVFIRDEDTEGFGYDVKDAMVYKETVSRFISFYKNEAFSPIDLPDCKLLNEFYCYSFAQPSINVMLEPYAALENNRFGLSFTKKDSNLFPSSSSSVKINKISSLSMSNSMSKKSRIGRFRLTYI